ncbi:MAG TPA: ADP-ribosylglycohydrolase family protein [Candidatus Hydrogenedentes bacterium]|nr:ADP-ribosylglycohydrolase family protein [Candidatus Hydrogenedentota bacterium]HQM49981.1 ADP-ribosylglycohydrolase family protein [Candidatus Hydrogenedentota bacterium]
MRKNVRRMRLFHGALAALVLTGLLGINAAAQDFRRLPLEEYRDKMAGGWIGQMVGVGWGGPTEFKWMSEIIPEDKVPVWKPELVNQFEQDDLYVEMTFLRTLEIYGLDVSSRQAGIDFANSEYKLWHANGQGRKNLRAGIAPPDSGHPQFNKHADCIDYQIEADYAGLIAPGMPNLAIELGEKFGRLMNYGDGLYGGQFMSGMYAEAFFESDPLKLIQAGLQCIPEGSQYAECIRDVVAWHEQNPDDWQATWHLLQAKYHDDPMGRRFVCGKSEKGNIDAKMNGAYVVIGLLYGKGDMDKTITISTRCGQDSDCNPSSAAGILAAALGRKRLPDKFTSAINPDGVFSHTAYTFPSLVAVCEKVAREAVIREGGFIEKDGDGKETLVIPVRPPRPGALMQSWEPGPPENCRYSQEELSEIVARE